MAALVLAGCQPKAGAPAEGQATVEVGPNYSATDGLFVPEDTRQSLGLRTVEVAEQAVPMKLDLPLRVYRTAATASLASGSATLEQAEVLSEWQSVQLLASDGQTRPARITRISYELKAATGMAEVLVEIPNASEPFPVGTFLEGRVTVGGEESVVTIPRTALLEASDGHSVYTVSGDYFVRTLVKVGAVSGDVVEITDGLYTGDEVVAHAVISLWMTELAAVKGGQACCAVPAKGK